MTVSDQIIAVLNALCEKFGIVIDWTATNILPYIQNLGSRIVTYEIATSIAWLIGTIIVVTIGYFLLAKMAKLEKEQDGDTVVTSIIATVFTIVVLIIGSPILGQQINDIIKCCTIPETIIIHYAKELMEVIK